MSFLFIFVLYIEVCFLLCPLSFKSSHMHFPFSLLHSHSRPLSFKSSHMHVPFSLLHSHFVLFQVMPFTFTPSFINILLNWFFLMFMKILLFSFIYVHILSNIITFFLLKSIYIQVFFYILGLFKFMSPYV